VDWIYLIIITLIGAIVQSATGFGFALIAVPIFLIVLNSTDAIHMVMTIIFFMSFLDWLKLRGHSSPKLLKWLNIGMLFGFPLGLLAFQQLNISVLKLIIALIILLFSINRLWLMFQTKPINIRDAHETQNWKTFLVGTISGALSTSLAMPGPPVMMYLVHQQIEKTVIRATILTYFIFSYSGALITQTLMEGISMNTWINSLLLVPVALVGVLIGHWIAPKINQKRFNQIIVSLLMIMSIVMLYQL